jgi:hypothetical protein
MVMKILLVLSVIFIFLYLSRDHFSPNSKTIPPCPPGTSRGKNGLDCRVKGDNMGH